MDRGAPKLERYLLKCTSYKGALLLQQASPAGAEAVLSLGLPIHEGFWKRVRTEESWSEDCRAPVLNNFETFLFFSLKGYNLEK